MTKSALLIVDVQNDFCPHGALPVPNGDLVVEPSNRAIEYAYLLNWQIFLSRDWHLAVTSHFKIYGGMWPVHCVQHTRGAKFHPDLLLPENANIVSKGWRPNEDGFSAFEGTTNEGEPLAVSLKRDEITRLFIGGLATDYCVRASVLDAIRYGFETYLLVDACRAVDLKPGDGDEAIAEMRNAGAVLLTTDELHRF